MVRQIFPEDGLLCIGHFPDIDLNSVDLHDLGIVRLTPGRVGEEQHQHGRVDHRTVPESPDFPPGLCVKPNAAPFSRARTLREKPIIQKLPYPERTSPPDLNSLKTW